MSPTPPPSQITLAAQLPGEGIAIELIKLFGKLIDGQTPAQRAQIWDQWIRFWQPLVDLMTRKKE